MELKDCAALLRREDEYLLITHIRPDGDTLGSAAALCHILRRLGKTAYLFPNPQVTETYAPFVSPYLAPPGFAPRRTISVDVADARMLPAGVQGPVWLALDHHPGGGGFGENSLVWPHKAACGELVLALAEELLGGVDADEASLLYIAVSTDTGCFRYGNTRADTFFAAGALTAAGADVFRLNKLLFRTKSRARLLLEGYICSSLRSWRNDQLNIAVVTLDMLSRAGATENDCEDLAALAGQVAGNRVSVTIRELEDGRCKLSLRTDGSVDASQVCARFGGGGHKMASGCELAMGPDEAAETIRAAIEEVWP